MRIIAIALALSGCTTATVAPVEPKLTTVDAPEEGRIYISFRNDYVVPICLYPTNWPDGAGTIDAAANRVWIEVDGARFSMADLDAGYCPACRTKVFPGQTANAFVRYVDFGLASMMQYRSKKLIFQPIAQRCR